MVSRPYTGVAALLLAHAFAGGSRYNEEASVGVTRRDQNVESGQRRSIP